MSRQELLNAIVMASVFVLVFSTWTICVLLWMVQYARRRKRFQRMLGLSEHQSTEVRALQLWREDYQARKGSAKPRKQTLLNPVARPFDGSRARETGRAEVSKGRGTREFLIARTHPCRQA